MACEAEEQAYNAKLAEAAQKDVVADGKETDAAQSRQEADEAEDEALVLYTIWQGCLTNP